VGLLKEEKKAINQLLTAFLIAFLLLLLF